MRCGDVEGGLDKAQSASDAAHDRALTTTSKSFSTQQTLHQLELGENSAVGEAFTNASKERWCIDYKFLLQRRDLGRTGRGNADRFWAIVLAS